MTYDLAGKRIFIAGHRGMVGAGIVRRLASEGCQVLTVARDRLDLRDQAGVRNWMATEKPQAVVIAAAKVGGIYANDKYPADFIYENLVIETNLIEAAFREGVEKLLFLGSSCIYPKMTPQPIPEEALLTGPLEPTNEWYAIAKIAGLKMCEAFRRQHGVDFISAMPTNLYGPGDNFDLEKSHVIPALIRKAHEAKLAGVVRPHHLGNGIATARISARRRCGRCHRSPLEDLFGGDARQRRSGTGRNDIGTRRACLRNRRVQGHNRQ